MHDTSSMEHIEGIDLSQQLSQVCLQSPLHHNNSNNSEEDFVSEDKFDLRICDDGVNLADQENPPDYICSQDFFCTPDFITPVDQQFSIDLDNKENSSCLRSPSALTPLRLKRPRPDPVHSHPTWLDDSPPDLGLEIIPLSEAPSMIETTSFTSTDIKAQLAQLSAIPPNPRGSLPSMRRRVQSPVWLQNPFLDVDAILQQKLTAQARMPAPLSGQTSISRYREDFHEIEEIGHGNFSRVFKALKRIDGCLYAVKRSQHPLRMTSERKQALTEVQALGAVGAHEHVVRYFTAWFESDYCYIQTELCDGTLTQLRNSDSGVSLEASLLEIMRQMASALSLIHSKGLVHLDLKPDNIYVLNGIYKLGDFGRATRADGTMDIEEGDSRYMPLEIINDDYSELPKVDMFALGATIYELAKGSPLPTSGSQFQTLRQAKLMPLPGYSSSFQSIIKALMDPTPSARPSAAELLKHSIFHHDVAPSPVSPTVPDEPT